jgi:hypothetical protein
MCADVVGPVQAGAGSAGSSFDFPSPMAPRPTSMRKGGSICTSERPESYKRLYIGSLVKQRAPQPPFGTKTAKALALRPRQTRGQPREQSGEHLERLELL